MRYRILITREDDNREGITVLTSIIIEALEKAEATKHLVIEEDEMQNADEIILDVEGTL